MHQVVHGGVPWTVAESEHLAGCATCRAEWALLRAGADLHRSVVVDPERIAQGVFARLRAEPETPAPIRRLPWRAGVIGLVSAAACLALVFALPRQPHRSNTTPVATTDTAELAILPELQALDTTQLAALLSALGPAAADATPGVPHLGDLTSSELEQLLRAEGGE
jgi:hypothetical protein